MSAVVARPIFPAVLAAFITNAMSDKSIAENKGIKITSARRGVVLVKLRTKSALGFSDFFDSILSMPSVDCLGTNGLTQ